MKNGLTFSPINNLTLTIMSTKSHLPTRAQFDDYINASPVEIIKKDETDINFNHKGKMYVQIDYSFKVPFSPVQYEDYCKQKCLIDLLRNYCDNQRIQFGAIEDILNNPKDNFDQEITLSGAQKSVLVNYGKIWDELLDS